MATQRYLVTARKYRPQLFEEVVAQEHVTETLKNAIRLDRLAHAYLFSGPRGVGKTTAARILAKAINCTTPLEEREGGAEPCRRCDSCRTFEEGRSLNIIEIDAASNNRIDDIRDLRETVRIPPQGGRKKVYIVDEVHMLSAAAFNALLKTLEEPPPHVLFIFATTEPHKVLPTILSRCQRFDFRRISVPEIVSRLREICGEEEIAADDASLMLVARKGDGALRDALSVFDQAVSLCGSELQYVELAQALGVVDIDLYFDVTRFVIERSASGMLQLVDRIVRSGYDLQEFLAGLAEHLRNLLVARAMSDASLIEAAEATRERYQSAAASFSEADLLRLLTLVSDKEETIRNSPQQRLRLETSLLKMASISLAADLGEALDKLDRLEKMARGGKLPSNPEYGNATDGGDAETGGVDRESGGTSARVADARGGSPSRSTPRSSSGASSERVSSSESGTPSSIKPSPPESHEPRSHYRPAAGGDAPTKPSSASAEQPTQASAEQPTQASAERPSTASAERSSQAPGESPLASAESPLTSAESPLASAESPSQASAERPAAASGARSASPDPPPAREIFGKPALTRKNPPTATGTAASSAVHQESDIAVADESSTGPLADIWAELVNRVTKDRIHVGSLLKHSSPERMIDGVAVIGVPDDFHHRLLSHQQDYLIEQIKPLLSITPRSMRFIIREDLEAPGAEETGSDFDPYEYMQRKRRENPVIRAIFDQFGGELVW